MIYYLTHIRDTVGSNYLGINIPKGVIDPFLDELLEIIGEDDYEVFTKNQQNRDHDSYHITVINVMEYNSLTKKMGMDKFVNSLDNILKYEIDDLKMLGVGTAQKNENITFFVVCESEKLKAIRDRYELPNQYFHTTLGFKFKDVFGIRKNEVIKKEGKFLKLLKQEYYKKDNWNFIKKIENFDLDPQAEVIPIEVTRNSMKFKCDNYYMDITYLDNEKFYIVTKYQLDKELPRMSETEISKILNK
jgi:hypothetical protein